MEKYDSPGARKAGRSFRGKLLLASLCTVLLGTSMTGCSLVARETPQSDEENRTVGLGYETARDGSIDFTILQQENPEIWGWIYIPGTRIDAPLLQNASSDDYYRTHTADGQQGEEGALYIEIPNQTNLCDFNTVIHGKDQKEDDLFYDLHKFEDKDFFDDHQALYIYTPDNLYIYVICGAGYDEDSDILRRYDYTTEQGCSAYLTDYYNTDDASAQRRENWDTLSAGNFLLTLDGTAADGRQYVVTAALINAGNADMQRDMQDAADSDSVYENLE